MNDASSFSLLEVAEGAWVEKTDYGTPGSPATHPYAVWLDDDIIGVGFTVGLAIEDARNTVRTWNK